MADWFGVTFTGSITAGEEESLSRAGFGVHRDGISTPARHAVLNVEATDADAAVARVEGVVDRKLESVRAVPLKR